MRQVALIPSGCQQWINQVCAVGGRRFAYVSTLAVYIYRLDDFVLEKVLAAHQKTITSIAWSPHDPDLLVTTCADHVVKVWNVETEAEQVFACTTNSYVITHVEWSYVNPNMIMHSTGFVIRTWEFTTNKMTVVKDLDHCKISVMRANKLAPTKLAIGLADNAAVVYDLGTRKTQWFKFGSPVIDLAWDPKSPNYLLVAQKNGSMSLHDVDTETEMIVFNRQTGGLKGIAWVPSMPGSFVSITDRTGVMRLWNVSQNHPMKLIRTGQGGFQTVVFVKDSPRAVCSFKDGAVGLCNVERQSMEWSTKGGHTETIFDCAFRPSDPNILATASYDGTVRFWDVRTHSCLHTMNTAAGVIYCVTWAPDGSLLAASSADCKVVIMDPEKSNVIRTMTHHTQAVLRVAWHLIDAELLASTSKDHTCAIFRPDGTVLRKLRHGAPVYGCAWSPHFRNSLATGCDDGTAFVWDVGGILDNGPNVSSRPAGNQLFKGHKKKVFNVVWAPLMDSLFASGSDDGTIRIWDILTGDCKGVLEGHNHNVRALLWHSEIPWLLVSGSWDATIRMWDVRDGTCLRTCTDHHADVYGLTAHPQRPFLLASSSRDTTLRLWSAVSGEPFGGLMARAMFGNVASDWAIQGRRDGADVGDIPERCRLGGRGGAALLDRTKGMREDSFQRFQIMSDFFCVPGGVEELWRLAAISSGKVVVPELCRGHGRGALARSDDEGLRVAHVGEVLPLAQSKAEELEALRAGRRNFGGMRKDELLRAAAAAHLRLGRIERYCELMKELGEWDAALAVAPAVSHDYWRELLLQRAEVLQAEHASLDDLAPLYIASGKPGQLVDILIRRGGLRDAFAIAKAHADGCFDAPSTSESSEKMPKPTAVHPNGGESPRVSKALPFSRKGSLNVGVASNLGEGSLERIRRLMAEEFAERGEPVWAACCHLSLNDAPGAVQKLVRGNELELAVAVEQALKVPNDGQSVRLLIAKCLSLHNWHLALSLAQRFLHGAARERCIRMIAASFIGDASDVALFYEAAGVPSPGSYLTALEREREPAEIVLSLLLARDTGEAVKRGLTCLRAKLLEEGWTLQSVTPLAEALGCVQAAVLTAEQRDELLAFSAYVGALLAIRAGYAPVIGPLMRHAQALFLKMAEPFPMALPLITFQELSLSPADLVGAIWGLRDIANCESIDASLRMSAAELLTTLDVDPRTQTCQWCHAPCLASCESVKVLSSSKGRSSPERHCATLSPTCTSCGHHRLEGSGMVVPTGHGIPSGASRARPRRSSISQVAVQGPAVCLEDGLSLVPLGEALMWARVNRFSPLASGHWLRAL